MIDDILFEPFKIKMVEALPFSTSAERRSWIEAAHFNIFALTSDQVTIDLLTDSGTGAMSDKQWGAMLSGDESYAGSRSFIELETTARNIFCMPHIIPVHQGRAAENLLFNALLKPGQVVPSNGLFDTTLANILSCGAEGVDLPTPAAADPFTPAPFKGNFDLTALESLLQRESARIGCIVLTVTNNTGGGQPVSLENMKAVRELANRHKKILVIDACRFAENAYFIKLRESKYAGHTPLQIAQEMLSLGDAITFSAKKDALSNIGGLLCVKDQKLADQVKDRMVRIEGFPTYGGLAGYSLAAMAQGLKEVLDDKYLEYRIRTVAWAVERLVQAGVPVIQPAGGHGVYIEAARFFPHIPRSKFPGLVLTTALYVEAGIRACELGGVAFGKKAADGTEVLPQFDLVRLAFPRRVYTEAHIGFVVSSLIEIYKNRSAYKNGFGFLNEAPMPRHFRSTFRQISLS